MSEEPDKEPDDEVSRSAHGFAQLRTEELYEGDPDGPPSHVTKGASPEAAAIPIIVGILFLGVAAAVIVSSPMWLAALVLGGLVAAAVCYVILVAMPRAIQIGLMGTAIGVSADAGYAKFTDQTPITLANALVKLADALTKSVGLIAADAQVNVAAVTSYFVWAFILSTIVFMGFSFLIKND